VISVMDMRKNENNKTKNTGFFVTMFSCQI